MKLHRLPLLIIAASFALPQFGLNAQTTVATDPVGFTTINITPGTNGARRSTLMSIPLLEVDPSVGGITAGTISAVVSSNSIVVTNAGWTSGNLSKPAEPFVVQITSGPAAGRFFLIASSAGTGGASGGAALANTTTNIFISSIDLQQFNNHLTNAGVAAGNTFKIYACNTLSWFGTPGTNNTGIRGGTNAASADNVMVTINGQTATYYFNTSSSNWTRNSPPQVANNIALHPSYGVTYSRLATNELRFVSTGEVPILSNSVAVKNSGTTILASYYPTTNSLRGLGIQNLPGWVSSPTPASADKVILIGGGNSVTYFYNGTNWRRTSPQQLADNVLIPIGSSIQIFKPGNATGYSWLLRPMNYNLN